MRILYITRALPYPPRSGALAYSAGVIASLRTAATLDVVCNIPANTTERPNNEPDCTWNFVELPRFNRAGALISPLPGECHRYNSADYLRTIERLLASNAYDFTILDHLGSGFALDAVRKSARAGHLVYMSHNHETSVRRDVARFSSNNPLKLIYGLIDAKKVASVEAQLLTHCTTTTAISHDDLRSFGASGARRVELLSPVFGGTRKHPRQITAATPRTVLLLGSLEWHAKSESLMRFLRAAEEPLTASGIRLEIVGRANVRARQAVRRQGSWVEHYDYVENLTPHLDRARMGLMIDQVGGGFKTKLLDYFFSGLPVVGIKSQLNGLPGFEDGTHFIGVDDAEGVANAIVDYIDDLPMLNALQQRAYEDASLLFDSETRERQLRLILNSH